MATSNKTDAISNGKRYDSNRLCATVSELGGKFPAAAAVSTGDPRPCTFPDDQNIRPVCPAMASATKKYPHFFRAHWIGGRATFHITSRIRKPTDSIMS